MGAYKIYIEIIKTNFRHSQDFEFTHICKAYKDWIVHFIAASSKQKQKLLPLQVAIVSELITPGPISQQSWTKEIAKKNCITLIVKYITIAYFQSIGIEAFKK
jgi:hypothetical protein